MTQLHDRFEDLVADAPAYVVPDARAAWAAGARRRTRHRVGVAAAVVAVLAVVASAVTWLSPALDPEPIDTDGSGINGYPTHVDKPWIKRDLPNRPGAIAGVLLSEDETLRAVSRTGRVWTVPRAEFSVGRTTALSADGTRLAYFDGPDRFVLRDLVTGAVGTAAHEGTFDGPATGGRKVGYQIYELGSAFWSPDGQHVFLQGAYSRRLNAELLVGMDGSTTLTPRPRGGGSPAGWTPDGDLVWLATSHKAGVVRAQAVVTTPAGVEVRRVDLALPAGFKASREVLAGSRAVSPDGSRILVAGTASRPILLSLADGSLVEHVEEPFLRADCPISWATDRPTSTLSEQDAGPDDGQPRVVVDSALHTTCALWASDALAGKPHPPRSWMPFVALPVAVALVLVGGALDLRRHRRRRAHRLG